MRIESYRSKYQKYVDFIYRYENAINASSGSEVDSNANVQFKNITTMAGEIPKKDYIGTNRLLMIDKLTTMFGESVAEEYIRQLDVHEIYKHDETSVAPYTYCGKESIVVIDDGAKKLISLEDLYDQCIGKEELLDAEKGVWGKYPENLMVADRTGFTSITRLVKKVRHRDLVAVKTEYGENVIVTDNHPMIVSDDIDKTVEAKNVSGATQYRVKNTHSFAATMPVYPFNQGADQIGTYCIHRNGKYVHYTGNTIDMTDEFGYFLGYFIAEGWYASHDGVYDTVMIKSKDRETLCRCASAIYEATGCYGNIANRDGRDFYTLSVRSIPLTRFMMEDLKIATGAYNKTLPVNIFEQTESFARCMIAGIIDGDGTINTKGQISIRMTSRKCISQITTVVTALGNGASMLYQDWSAKDHVIKSKYPMFGINFYASESEYPHCQKLSGYTEYTNRYEDNIWAKVRSVETISNEAFLSDCEFIYDITTESHTFALNNLWVHNCVSISMYPFILKGLKEIGGASSPPKHLASFCGSFINLVFAVAAQFAGAVATPEFLTYFDYFARKEWGDDYYLNPDKIVSIGAHVQTIDEELADYFQQVTYSLNQPAAARNYQSVFWNIAYFDNPYFHGIFDNFVFPDGSEPRWESVSWLQKRYMKWLNNERLRCPDLTFPVETANLLDNGIQYVDTEWTDYVAQMWAEGHSFFLYRSDSVDSLASCCRLKNNITSNTFSYTLGAGGIATGSKGVITININRLVQNAVRDGVSIEKRVREQIKKNHMYLTAFNEIIKDRFNARMLPIYDSGFIKLSGQYLTNGINGFVEGAEFLGIKISPNEEYFKYGESILRPIYEENQKARTEEIMFNTEFVPAENLGVKNAKWDKEAGYIVPRECYNSYFYLVEDENTNVLDKFILHGDRLTQYLDGGSALHCNLDEHLSKVQYLKLMEIAMQEKCSYFTFNIPNTVCNNCGYIEKRPIKRCPSCGSNNLDWLTRIIGYLKRVSSFSEARQKEASKRYYADGSAQV